MQGWEAAWQAGGRMVQTPTSPVLPQVVLNFNGTSQELMAVSEHKLYWPLGYPPPDIPKCGFDNEDPACNQGDQPMLSEALNGATASSPAAGRKPRAGEVTLTNYFLFLGKKSCSGDELLTRRKWRLFSLLVLTRIALPS